MKNQDFFPELPDAKPAMVLRHLLCLDTTEKNCPLNSHPNNYIKKDFEKFMGFYKHSHKNNALLVFMNYNPKGNKFKKIIVDGVTNGKFNTSDEIITRHEYETFKKYCIENFDLI